MTWPDAVLFDLDGTLVDSEDAWAVAKASVAVRHGSPWSPDDAAWAVGRPTTDYAGRIAAGSADGVSTEVVAAEISAAMADAMQTGGLWRPGARAALSSLGERGVPLALVTMSYRSIVDGLLESLSVDPFTVVVAGDDVRRPKPHPEPYTTALDALGLSAEGCVAVEDSDTGTTSARAAGLRTVVVGESLALSSDAFWDAVRA